MAQVIGNYIEIASTKAIVAVADKISCSTAAADLKDNSYFGKLGQFE